MRNTKLLANALALGAIGLGVAACNPGTTSAAQSQGQGQSQSQGQSQGQGQNQTNPAGGATSASASGAGSAMGSASGAGFSTGPGSYILQAMPTGMVWIERGTHGHLQARVQVFGLTPGSSHQVSIDGPLGRPVLFPVLTADAAGQANTTLTSIDGAGWLRPLSRFVIRLGNASGDPLAAEPIAESTVLPPRPGAGSTLQAVTAEGARLARPAGQATITYNAAAQTLTVTLTASSLNPGPHAAHIHLGSCQNQGGVKYMMADFTADADGTIAHQTRVITGVTSVPGPGNWYLNLHQGGMNQILAHGVPTLSFRPMLCADLTTFATIGTATPNTSPAATPTAATPTTTPSMTTPTAGPSMTTPTATPISTPTPSGSPSTPSAVPTHY
jgi:hypothetical protein